LWCRVTTASRGSGGNPENRTGHKPRGEAAQGAVHG
jgi:hypothetical protein